MRIRVLLLSLLWGGSLFLGNAAAQTPTITVETTRLEQFEWICEDANGNEISRHTRQDKAQTNCTNQALADPGSEYFIRPSAYRVVATIDAGGTQPPGASPGTATLSWTPPTQYDDGSGLADLAGFKVYWGTSSGSYTNQADVPDPQTTTFVIENLNPGTYYFAATAYNQDGVESTFSAEASKTID